MQMERKSKHDIMGEGGERENSTRSSLNRRRVTPYTYITSSRRVSRSAVHLSSRRYQSPCATFAAPPFTYFITTLSPSSSTFTLRLHWPQGHSGLSSDQATARGTAPSQSHWHLPCCLFQTHRPAWRSAPSWYPLKRYPHDWRGTVPLQTQSGRGACRPCYRMKRRSHQCPPGPS